MNVKVSWSVSRAQLLTDGDETVKKRQMNYSFVMCYIIWRYECEYM
jgi:hypothetical protein